MIKRRIEEAPGRRAKQAFMKWIKGIEDSGYR